MHKLQNILNFTFELTFLIGGFLNVFLYMQEQDPNKPLDTAEAFSQIAMVNGLRGNFSEMMQMVVNFAEYNMSRVAMDLLLNQVQIKPIFEEDLDESEGLIIDPSMEVGHIKGESCEFGINDKEHIDICKQ